jgi:hypothetical protein
MNSAQLTETLRLHNLWLVGDTLGAKANLAGANLIGADLAGANLTRANLTRANLAGANLIGADLAGANLTRANLTRANLYNANLSGADLSGANLTRAELAGADLYKANLRGADLAGAIINGIVCQSGPLGSRRDYLTTIWQPDWENEQVTAGCWRGTLTELAERVTRVHGDSRYGREYVAAIAYHQDMVKIVREGLPQSTTP